MKIQKKRTRILLLAALVLIPSLILYSGTGEALGPIPGGEWVCTPEALEKEEAGFCSANRICREFCLYSEPTGDFMCFSY